MRGLVIHPIRRQPNPVPEGHHPFGFFFQPILPALDRFYWVSHNSPIQYVDVGEETRSIGELVKFDWTQDLVLFQPGTLLPKYAVYVKEDWNTLYGFLQKPDPQRFMKELDPLMLQDAKDSSSFIKGRVFDERGYQERPLPRFQRRPVVLQRRRSLVGDLRTR